MAEVGSLNYLPATTWLCRLSETDKQRIHRSVYDPSIIDRQDRPLVYNPDVPPPAIPMQRQIETAPTLGETAIFAPADPADLESLASPSEIVA